jgi:DNA-binding NtrC family response regulator
MHERLLIVEDDAAMRDLLQEDLEQVGYSIVTAVDGHRALDYILNEEELIDALITDVQMPGIKGAELLAVARARRAEMPVIVITAFGSSAEAAAMMKGGAFKYLTKPFEADTLLTLVAQALAKSEPEREQVRRRHRLPFVPPHRR